MIGAGGFGLRKCILIESDLRAFDHSTFPEVQIFANIFATFCMHLRNDVLSDFIQAGSQYHLDCKYLSSKIIRLCHHDHYLFIMM